MTAGYAVCFEHPDQWTNTCVHCRSKEESIPMMSLAFPEAEILPGHSTTLIARPQVACKIGRIVIHSNCPLNLLRVECICWGSRVNSVTVTEGMTAVFFRENTSDMDADLAERLSLFLKAIPLAVGMPFQLMVTNQSEEKAKVTALAFVEPT